MENLVGALRVVHVFTAILMAWPFYALVSTNQRLRLGPPLGDRADTLMENLIKNRTVPCFVFQATALISGLALLRLRGPGIRAVYFHPLVGLKFLLLLLVGSTLAYVHFRLQPQIDALFAGAGSPVSADVAHRIMALRVRRKRLASLCMFSVLTAAMLGIQVWAPFPSWLSGLLVLGIGLFTWRAYKTVTPFGWY